MKIYLVGGAVRDELLGLPVSERDWVVVGSTPQEMLAQGYFQVGKDFPVFIHPKSGEEYALARTERKTGPGYKGFAFNSDPTVTLELDLLRRDLTINAIARDNNGNLIDPYHGKEDLTARVLRHVSAAFAEDPVRLLRVARFAARFDSYGFTIADETKNLLRQMVQLGEVHALVAERVWQELIKALKTANPLRFFQELEDCGALIILFPAFANLPEEVKPAWQHCIKLITQLTTDTVIRFAVLFYPYGIHQENPSTSALDTLAKQYKIPKEYNELARLVLLHHVNCLQAKSLSAEALLKLLLRLDALRRPERFKQLLIACKAINQGHYASENHEFKNYLLKALGIIQDIAVQPLVDQGLTGLTLAKSLEIIRLDHLKKQLLIS